MSISEIIRLVGDRTGNSDTGLYSIDGLRFPVRILDARQVFGRIDVRITPINGVGERWISAEGLVKA